MTILEAVRAVMAKGKSPMTAKELYEAIVSAGLFEFRSANATHVVSTQLRRHTMNLPPKDGRKLFRLVGSDRYELLDT